MSTEKKAVEAKEVPLPKREASVKVDRKALERAMMLDPHRRAGAFTPGSEEAVLTVTRALVKEGALEYEGEGAFDDTVHQALREYGGLDKLAEAAGFEIV